MATTRWTHTTPHTSLSIPLETNTSYHSTTVLHLRRTHPTRGLRSTTATRAGPTTNQFIFAFTFPLSLLAVTAFTAWQIGNRLDEKFLEELAMNEALREEMEEEEDDDEFPQIPAPRKEKPALPPRKEEPSRNRPRREI